MRLRKECEHGRWETHPLPGATPTGLLGSMGMTFTDEDICPGGEFLPEGALVIEKVDGEWPQWALQLVGHEHGRPAEALDALASQVGESE